MLPACSAAITISPSGLALVSTNSSPGGGPQCSTTCSASPGASRENHSRYCRAGTRIGLPASWSEVSQSGS
ncbi:Uncharacterised protein [Mycobacteroides abscessus subsp. abscessus]|nr:Uncharacterised protein [Mycobacteroides abscessus subsp. abscessus]